jgi:hypothetical protein
VAASEAPYARGRKPTILCRKLTELAAWRSVRPSLSRRWWIRRDGRPGCLAKDPYAIWPGGAPLTPPRQLILRIIERVIEDCKPVRPRRRLSLDPPPIAPAGCHIDLTNDRIYDLWLALTTPEHVHHGGASLWALA